MNEEEHSIVPQPERPKQQFPFNPEGVRNWLNDEATPLNERRWTVFKVYHNLGPLAAHGALESSQDELEEAIEREILESYKQQLRTILLQGTSLGKAELDQNLETFSTQLEQDNFMEGNPIGSEQHEELNEVIRVVKEAEPDELLQVIEEQLKSLETDPH